jgi:putative ubiquitin-RnfH superfamily antitoxin RatB of RatAB toxin-antitoxin module
MADADGTIPVQVCYAWPERNILLDLQLPAGCTVQQAIIVSGILEKVPELDLASIRVGVYGKLKPLEAILEPHDRIELYRPLIADPKEARRRRASVKRSR